MKRELTKEEKDYLIQNIMSVLETGEEWEDEIFHQPVGAIIQALEEIDGVEVDEDGFDTNGWQWDWWQRFNYNGKVFALFGSGWNGGLMCFPE